MELKRKIALVTGASKGIGSAAAIALAREGCSVVINFKSDADAAKGVLEECNKLSKNNLLVQADVSDENQILSMFEKIKTEFGHLDVLVNNAGIFQKRSCSRST